MRRLTPEGEKLIEDIAFRNQVSVEAARVMLDALERGGGSMAQFSHYELGGSGQWLRGGMTMVGDMFNNALKAKVDSLASELSAVLANEPASGRVFAVAQSQSQSSGGASIFEAGTSSSGGDWWPADLGVPASVGAQNDMRYAYFPGARRLALYRGGHVEVLDTGEHMIGGFGQQQGGSDSITLTSQLGTVPLSSLRRVGAAAKPAEDTKPEQFAGTGPAAAPVADVKAIPTPPADTALVLSLLEKLGELRDKGVLTDEEFAAKKAELLKRL